MTSRIRGSLRTWSTFALPVVLVTLAGCSNVAMAEAEHDALPFQSSDDPEVHPASARNGVMVGAGPVTTVTSFDAYSGQLPESIAVYRFGDIHVSMSALGEIWKLGPAGAFQEVAATFTTPGGGLFGGSGMRFDARGDLYVANSANNQDARVVWKVAVPVGAPALSNR
ncbi:hypothetical protein BH23GEM9_BH23GEM9_28990 [soil metagenome]